ncbi:hypothetical protein FHS31_001866 [Sphingomonas vulcanisoli]|uniref:DUF2285 domain-containing protein n=1 Tax=Sphingomonas vulcanisoli TaxID=1658060 RepID=A0ABX0TU48_9SPHN|nr:hypothetical protein [Sphingomonas vulcanisoli]NIJ08249.1 hypothetical protein [Sphingomonas vulcanisoli]
MTNKRLVDAVRPRGHSGKPIDDQQIAHAKAVGDLHRRILNSGGKATLVSRPAVENVLAVSVGCNPSQQAAKGDVKPANHDIRIARLGLSKNGALLLDHLLRQARRSEANLFDIRTDRISSALAMSFDRVLSARDELVRRRFLRAVEDSLGGPAGYRLMGLGQ